MTAKLYFFLWSHFTSLSLTLCIHGNNQVCFMGVLHSSVYTDFSNSKFLCLFIFYPFRMPFLLSSPTPSSVFVSSSAKLCLIRNLLSLLAFHYFFFFYLLVFSPLNPACYVNLHRLCSTAKDAAPSLIFQEIDSGENFFLSLFVLPFFLVYLFIHWHYSVFFTKSGHVVNFVLFFFCSCYNLRQASPVALC